MSRPRREALLFSTSFCYTVGVFKAASLSLRPLSHASSLFCTVPPSSHGARSNEYKPVCTLFFSLSRKEKNQKKERHRLRLPPPPPPPPPPPGPTPVLLAPYSLALATRRSLSPLPPRRLTPLLDASISTSLSVSAENSSSSERGRAPSSPPPSAGGGGAGAGAGAGAEEKRKNDAARPSTNSGSNASARLQALSSLPTTTRHASCFILPAVAVAAAGAEEAEAATAGNEGKDGG